MDVTVLGTVISKGVIPTRKGLRIFQAVIRDESAMIEVSWPGQPFLDRVIKKDDKLLLTGAVRFFHGRQLQPREMVNLGPDSRGDDRRARALGVSGHRGALVQGHSRVDRRAPRCAAPARHGVSPRAHAQARGRAAAPEALRLVHRPRSIADAMRGMSRLAFEELFFVHILHSRARDLARETREGISFTNKRDLTIAAQGGAAVRAHERADARDARDREGHGERSPHASLAAGRRRQREDDRRALRDAARRRERLSRRRSWRPRSCWPSSMREPSSACSRHSACPSLLVTGKRLGCRAARCGIAHGVGRATRRGRHARARAERHDASPSSASR